MSNHHSTSSILLLLARLLHILRVLVPRNNPPEQRDEQESTNTDTSVIHIRRSDWHIIRKGEKHNGEHQPCNGNDVHSHTGRMTQVKRTVVHCPAPHKDVGEDGNEVG